MTDQEIAARIGNVLGVLGNVHASRIALADMVMLLGGDASRERVVTVLAQLGFFPGADECYAVPEAGLGASGCSERARATELKVEVTIRALAERGVSEPSPEEIHEEAERLFAGHIPPQEFIEALDRIARRPPTPPARRPEAGERHERTQVLDPGQEALIEEFRGFLAEVAPADFERAA